MSILQLREIGFIGRRERAPVEPLEIVRPSRVRRRLSATARHYLDFALHDLAVLYT
jgi:hypothetical protein